MASALPRRAVRASAKAMGTSGQAVEQTWALAERDAQQALAKLRGRLNSTLPVVQPWPRGGLNE